MRVLGSRSECLLALNLIRVVCCGLVAAQKPRSSVPPVHTLASNLSLSSTSNGASVRLPPPVSASRQLPSPSIAVRSFAGVLCLRSAPRAAVGGGQLREPNCLFFAVLCPNLMRAVIDLLYQEHVVFRLMTRNVKSNKQVSAFARNALGCCPCRPWSASVRACVALSWSGSHRCGLIADRCILCDG
jgi:hypothetical protein